MIYRVGTRGSKLALIQTNDVIRQLKQAYPEDDFEAVVIKTTGDKNQTAALDAIGSKGVFVDEIEKQLLSGQIHLAVHSMKDMPDKAMDGLTFTKAWKREDARDILILKNGKSLEELPTGAVIGTGSKRRAYQLKSLRKDLQFVGIRGNVDTRIRKLMEGSMDGIVLAAAGMKRLGREDEITEYLPAEKVIPAPAQGVLAIEIREDAKALMEMVDALADKETVLAVSLERGFLKVIGGDCHLPVAAYLDPDGIFYAMFGSADGEKMASARIPCQVDELLENERKCREIIDQAVKEIHMELFCGSNSLHY